MKPINLNQGELMTIEYFKEMCEEGCFIDYDGFGLYSDGKQVSDKAIKPSDFQTGNIDKNYTRLVWFSR
jgi:hypothetical protein